MKILRISIINPVSGQPVPLREWMDLPFPDAAEQVLIETDELAPFCVAKKRSEEKLTWEQAAAAGAPTRAQALAIYDARHAGLNEALKLIGGDLTVEITWTCDEDKNPNYATGAWPVNLLTGYVYRSTKTFGYRVRPVAAYVPRKDAILQDLEKRYRAQEVCAAEFLASEPVPAGMSFEQAFETYAALMKRIEGDRFHVTKENQTSEI